MGGVITLLFALFILGYGGLIVTRTVRREHYNIDRDDLKLAEFVDKLNVKDSSEALLERMEIHVFLQDEISPGSSQCENIKLKIMIKEEPKVPWKAIKDHPFKANSTRICRLQGLEVMQEVI